MCTSPSLFLSTSFSFANLFVFILSQFFRLVTFMSTPKYLFIAYIFVENKFRRVNSGFFVTAEKGWSTEHRETVFGSS